MTLSVDKLELRPKQVAELLQLLGGSAGEVVNTKNVARNLLHAYLPKPITEERHFHQPALMSIEWGETPFSGPSASEWGQSRAKNVALIRIICSRDLQKQKN